MRDGLVRHVEELELTDRVIFTGARTDVPDLLALADVVVHCSIRPEPFGRVVVEALAAGRPLVAADGGGVVEIVEPDRTGVLVPAGDASALAAAIGRVLDDPDAAAAMGRAGRTAMLERFGVSGHVEAISAIHRRALGR